MRHLKKGNRRGILALLLPLALALFGGCGHEEDVQGQRQENNATEQPETQNGEPTVVITVPYSRQDGVPSDQAIDHIDFTISCVDAPDLGQCPSSYRVKPNAALMRWNPSPPVCPSISTLENLPRRFKLPLSFFEGNRDE